MTMTPEITTPSLKFSAALVMLIGALFLIHMGMWTFYWARGNGTMAAVNFWLMIVDAIVCGVNCSTYNRIYRRIYPYGTDRQTLGSQAGNATGSGNAGQSVGAGAASGSFAFYSGPSQAAYANALIAAGTWTDVNHRPWPIRREPQQFGEIVAWRCWRIQSGWLTSMAMNDIWLPGEIMSVHEPVGDHNQSGIHAWKSEADAVRYGIDHARYVAMQDMATDQMVMHFGFVAIGRVHLWGDIVEHEIGYRAEHARIIAIDRVMHPQSHYDADLLAKVRAMYGMTGENEGSK